MSKKNRVTAQGRKEDEVGTILLDMIETVLLSIIYLLS